MELIFSVLMAYGNAVRAKRKGYSAWGWGLISFFAFMLAYVAGAMLLMAAFYNGDPMDQYGVTAFFNESLLRSVTILMAGIGGFLAVRYAIDRLITRNQGGGQPEEDSLDG